MVPIKIPDKVRQQLNNDLKELGIIGEHIAQAKRANLPAVEMLEERHQKVMQDIAAIKAEYFPHKR